MPDDLLIKAALERQEVFRNLDKHLQSIKETARKLDPDAEIYLFGSVAEKKHNYSSDIEVLIITKTKLGRVLAELWKAGIGDPFEIHVQPQEKLETYKRRARLTKV